MKTFYIDFAGSCEIEAESFSEAIKKFWECVNEEKALPASMYEVQGIEIKK